MCTVTYIPQGETRFITSNRDEKRGRPLADAPAIFRGQTGRLLFPRDPQAGGTWIVLHEKGHALVLLNGGWVKHSFMGPYRKSRGLILLDLADSFHPLETFYQIDLTGVEPFTVILLKDGKLDECRWDGREKYHQQPNPSMPHIWSSVTLYSPAVSQKRRQWFEDWLTGNPHPGQSDIWHFHEFTGDGDPRNDLLMSREGQLQTVSITMMRLEPGGPGMLYRDMTHDPLPFAPRTNQLTFKKNMVW